MKDFVLVLSLASIRLRLRKAKMRLGCCQCRQFWKQKASMFHIFSVHWVIGGKRVFFQAGAIHEEPGMQHGYERVCEAGI